MSKGFGPGSDPLPCQGLPPTLKLRRGWRRRSRLRPRLWRARKIKSASAKGRRINRAQLRYIHENKTAALLTALGRLGAMAANASTKQLTAITAFGRALGLAFQVIDDILDVTQTSEKLGNVAAKKATYPAVIGLDKSRAEARRLTSEAHSALRSIGQSGAALRTLADYLLQREH